MSRVETRGQGIRAAGAETVIRRQTRHTYEWSSRGPLPRDVAVGLLSYSVREGVGEAPDGLRVRVSPEEPSLIPTRSLDVTPEYERFPRTEDGDTHGYTSVVVSQEWETVPNLTQVSFYGFRIEDQGYLSWTNPLSPKCLFLV